MHDMTKTAAAILGFVFGYVGWPLCFHLSKPLANKIVEPWNEKLIAFRVFTLFATFIFLVTSMFIMMDIISFLLSDDLNARVMIKKITFFSSLIGLIALGVISKVEQIIRKDH